MLLALTYTSPHSENAPSIFKNTPGITELWECDDYELSPKPVDVIKLAKTYVIKGHANWSRPTAEEVLFSFNTLDPQLCEDCDRVTFFNCLINSLIISFFASFYGNFAAFYCKLVLNIHVHVIFLSLVHIICYLLLIL